jgi:hypothetical protein
MPQISLGTNLQSAIATAAFVEKPYGGSTNGSYDSSGDSQPALRQYTLSFAGIAGHGYGYATGSFAGTFLTGDTYFSLMKGTPPSAVADINTNQRTSDILVTYTSRAKTFSGGTQSGEDFSITQSGAVVNWSPNGLSFTPRSPVRSGTPTWFWLRTYNNEHTIFGTVGATGSGSDLELDNYGNIDATQQFTLYLSSLLNFTVSREINY